jgi:hypothetical protein
MAQSPSVTPSNLIDRLSLNETERDRLCIELGNALLDKYQESANAPDLSQAIQYFQEALTLRPPGHSRRSSALDVLGIALHMRFNLSGGITDLHQAIAYHSEALELRPPGKRTRPDTCSNLALAYHKLFKQTGDIDTLVRAIDMHREAYRLSGPDDANHGKHLDNLAASLYTHFEQYGDLVSLDEAIKLHRDALALYAVNDPERSYSLQNLAIALDSRFTHDADVSTLNEAISTYREALRLMSSGNPNRPGALAAFAVALGSLHEQTGAMDALREAMDSSRMAVSLMPLNSPYRSGAFGTLGLVLHALFRRTGDLRALQESISAHREAVRLRPLGREPALTSLSVALQDLYYAEGDAGALAEAISLLREALPLKPQASRDVAQHNLAMALHARYDEDPDSATLDEIIELNRDALQGRPVGSLMRSYTLSNLAAALIYRYKVGGPSSMLLEATDLYQEVLKERPVGHPDRPSVLTSIADMRSQLLEAGSEGRVIMTSLYREALNLLPEDHPNRSTVLRKLGLVLYRDYPEHGGPSELNEAVGYLQSAVALQRPGHMQDCSCLLELANALLVRFQNAETYQSDNDWFDALDLVSRAAADDTASAISRIQQAMWPLSRLEDSCDKISPSLLIASGERLLNTVTMFVRLLPRAASFNLDRRRRLRALAGASDLGRIAALRALALKRAEVAVELMEEGRGVFWMQALHLRSSALSALPIDDRKELTTIFNALEREDDVREASDWNRDERIMAAERKMEMRRQMSDKAEALIRDIRSRPGFDRFLMIQPFKELSRAALRGPVVILLADAQRGGYALMIPSPDEGVRTLQLSSLKPEDLQRLRSRVPGGRSLDNLESTDGTPRLRFKKHDPADQYQQALGRLWTLIVQPVIDALGLLVRAFFLP